MKKIDINGWYRKELFEYFINFEQPNFNVTAQHEVTDLQLLRKQMGISMHTLYHYFATRSVNEVPELRYRLNENQEVIDWEQIECSTTVLLPDGSFSFTYLGYDENLMAFAKSASDAIKTVKAGIPLEPRPKQTNMIHCTTMPWVQFTSVQHPFDPRTEMGVPKIAFGKIHQIDGKSFLPVSIQVNHALVDGMHIGLFFKKMTELPKLYLDNSIVQ